MQDESQLRPRLLRAGLFLLFWTILGLSFASQFYLSSYKLGRPVSWGQAISFSLGDWYVWAVLSIPVIHLARRYRFDGAAWGRSLVLHLVASAVFSFLYTVLRAWVAQLQSRLGGVPVSFGQAFQPLLLKAFHLNLLIYWAIVSVSHAFDYYRQVKERELRTAELEKRLTQARLSALQMQLNPHFLFNTLHAISVLMHRDVRAADRMISRLSELLRYALESTDLHEVPLRQEIDFLKRYLEIEQTRFGDRLRVHFEIAPEALDAMVPNLILQPIVENAIRHGVEPHARPGRVQLRAARDARTLRIEVADNGQGLSPGGMEAGVGISNTRDRLRQLYGADHAFEFENGAEGGLVVRMTLPVKSAAPIASP